MPIHAYAHESAESQERHPVELSNLDEQHDKAGDSVSCDHCCHFSAHAIGLLRTSSRVIALQPTHVSESLTLNYASYHQAPPYHPPIA